MSAAGDIERLDREIATIRQALSQKISEREVAVNSLLRESKRLAVLVTAPIVPKKRGMQRLTETQVREIRASHAGGVSQASIARSYNVSYLTIHALVHGRTYKWVK